MKNIHLNLLTLSIILLHCSASFSQNRSINFEKSTFNEALQKAKTENKLIFMDVYTSWCGPCKWMAKNVFTNDTVADFYNQHFICMSVDAEKDAGPGLASQYKVSAYPTYLFITSDVKLVHEATGSMEASAFIAVGATALDSTKRIESILDKYNDGNRDPAFIREYLKMLHNLGQIKPEIVDWYLNTQKEENLITAENFDLIQLVSQSSERPLFKLLFKHRHEFSKIVGQQKVEDKISLIYYSNISSCIAWNFNPADSTTSQKLDEKKLKQEKEKILKSGYENAPELLSFADVFEYQMKHDYKKYMTATDHYLTTYKNDDQIYLNNYAWGVYEDSTIQNKEDLEVALKWVKKSISLDSNYPNNDTYAAILYKLKRKAEAKKAAEKAIETAKKDKVDYSATEELLKKIKKLE